MATWELAGKARRDFADMIEALTPDQLQQQSQCGAWTAEGVLAHIASFVETGFGGFVGTMVKSRFDFDKVSVSMANTQLQRSVPEVLASLRSQATKSAAMPMFPEEMTVTDIAIHTQDVRRPLGLPGALDSEVLRTALDFMTTNKKAKMMVTNKSLDGVRLVANDMDWSYGTGAEITGTGEAILMALGNRDVLDELSGDGLVNWS